MASKFLVDSHIHLFRAEDLPTLSWMTPSSPLNAAHSVPEYVSSVSHHVSPRRPLGFVFIETDRKSHLAADDSGWAHPLREFAFANATDVLGIVPWAPVPSGRAAMQRYRRRLADSRLLKGFRYLLQSHPRGTMLQAPFVDSLRWMGEERLVFELTVDCRGVGLWQLEEAVELLRRAHDGVAEERKLSLIVGAYSPPPSMSAGDAPFTARRPPSKARPARRARGYPDESVLPHLESTSGRDRALLGHIH